MITIPKIASIPSNIPIGKIPGNIIQQENTCKYPIEVDTSNMDFRILSTEDRYIRLQKMKHPDGWYYYEENENPLGWDGSKAIEDSGGRHTLIENSKIVAFDPDI